MHAYLSMFVLCLYYIPFLYLLIFGTSIQTRFKTNTYKKQTNTYQYMQYMHYKPSQNQWSSRASNTDQYNSIQAKYMLNTYQYILIQGPS
jgi:hypothetical protein